MGLDVVAAGASARTDKEQALCGLSQGAPPTLGEASGTLLGRGEAELTLADAASTMVDVLAQARAATYPADVCIVVESESDRSVVEAFIRSRFAHES